MFFISRKILIKIAKKYWLSFSGQKQLEKKRICTSNLCCHGAFVFYKFCICILYYTVRHAFPEIYQSHIA